MRYCFALDLKNDPILIEEYEKHHEAVWPEVLDSFKEAGILSMEIFRWGNRMFLIMDTDDSFSFEKKNEVDANSLLVQQWENLMSSYQQALPGSKPDEKWQLMKRIFHT
jgi:L-rhamnose mutarotase